MTLPADRFFAALCLVYIGASCSAIYDPREATTKPPNRREEVLPWYLNGEDTQPPDDGSRSPKWNVDPDETSRRSNVVNRATKSWSPWRRAPGSDIEQRTEVADPQEQDQFDQTEDQFDQTQDRFDQTQDPLDHRSFPSGSGGSSGSSQDRIPPEAGHDDFHNVPNIPSKRPAGKGSKLSPVVDTDKDLYEGVPSDSTKPHKERILESTKPRSVVAQYDHKLGVRCPEPDATGQFVYPPDCKFFVNCWKGRAFVQPCAPGTLFNPDTLECDFPHKVECYGGELAEFPSPGLDSFGRSEPLSSDSHLHPQGGKLREPKCPPQLTGMLPHPGDCTKFLQCAHGGTFIMDCGPGTVFNPAVSVCDWPYNVKGCEDALKGNRDNESSLTPPGHDISDHSDDYDWRAQYNDPRTTEAPRKVECPAHHVGLLPHPDTCKKFLQCANGVTYVMDCGPGTAFNPELSVCDWPYNVPGCSENKSGKTASTTRKPTTKPVCQTNVWPSRHPMGSWRGGQTSGDADCITIYEATTTTTTTTARPTWTPATWRPRVPGVRAPSHTTTTPSPVWSPSGRPSRMDSQGQPGNRWSPTWPPQIPKPHDQPGYPNQPTWSGQPDYTGQPSYPAEPVYPGQGYPGQGYPGQGYPGHPGHHGRPGQPGVHNQPGYSTQPVRPGRGYDSGQPNQYGHGPTGNSQSPNQYGWELPRETYGQQGPQGTYWQQPSVDQEYEPNSGPHGHHDHGQFNPSGGQNPPSGNHHHHGFQPGGTNNRPHQGYDHRYNGHGPHERPWTAEETEQPDQQVTQPPFHQNRWKPSNNTPTRQGYGRNQPGFSQTGYNRTTGSSNRNYGSINRTIPSSWPGGNGTWNQPLIPGSQPGVFRPTTWQNKSYEGQSEDRPWNQGTINPDDKLHDWQSRTNLYQQSTADKEAEAKMDQWAAKTNIFQQFKGQVRPGSKTAAEDSRKVPYPHGIYVIVNGTKGHYITKEIDANRDDAKGRTYRLNDLRQNTSTSYDGPNVFHSDGEAANGSVHRPASPDLTEADSRYLVTYSLRSPPPPDTDTNSHAPSLPTFELVENSSIARTPNFTSSETRQHPIVLLLPHSGGSEINRTDFERFFAPNYPSFGRPDHRQPPRTGPINSTAASYYPFVIYVQPDSNRSDAENVPDSEKHFVLLPYQPPAAPAFPSSHPGDSGHSADSRKHILLILSNGTLGSAPRVAPEDSSDTDRHVLPKPRPLPSDRSTPDRTNSRPAPFVTTTKSPVKGLPDREMILPTKKNVPTASPSDDSQTYSNVPTVSIESEDDGNDGRSVSTENSPVVPEVVEPDLDDYNVDVMDKKEVWKPVLVFENKTRPGTRTTTESSVIMKINRKTVDVDIFNAEAAPLLQEEPAFPVYFVPPVQPLTHASKSAPPTPISGQVIRLRGGSGPRDGYVEVQGAQPGWGIVCDSRNSWTLKEAHVVCRQLGYSRGAEMAWQGRNNRDGVPTWIAANSVTCTGNETRFQSCKFTHQPECRVERDAVGVRCVANRVAHCRKDEVAHEGHCYHLADPESSLNHAEALDYCSRRQARLIDITSQAENNFVSEWLTQTHPELDSIMTSGVGFTTLNRTLWLWEDSSRAKFKFAKWWPGWLEDRKTPPWVGSRPACIVMKRKFPCQDRPESICVADYFFWDTEDCTATMKGHAYICKRPYDDIGCIYGKGNQYTGNANVTSSGKECLSWADPRVAHPLLVNVVNRDVIEKLKTHNFCRNPNPYKESRPWCFTGPHGEREYCDIPSCGKISSRKLQLSGQCKPKHFECLPGECIPSPWVCDGEEDCTNGADERTCSEHLNLFQKSSRHRLVDHDVEKWLNTPPKTCALRCKEADFTCRSFTHKANGNICLLSDSNIGMTGALKPDKEYDYYEMKERSTDCDGMFVCDNRKCINQTQVCNGKNDCRDRSDERICTVENLNYAIRLAGSNNSHEGRVEVKVLGHWGQVCDDGFGLINAEVICKELGFDLGALEVRPGGFYGNLDPPTRFMVDQLKCRGDETSLRECDFEGWGVHNCQPEEAVGVVCKTAVDSCQEGYWKCDNSPSCIPTSFICDEVLDCPDGSDESAQHCQVPFEIRLVNGSSPLEGRVEVRHHGIWGTVCDDDFSGATAKVICRSLGYGGVAVAKKNGHFGPGQGPIWLDEVFCHGNETQLYRCEHNSWGVNNCDHNEDAGVICSPGDVNGPELAGNTAPDEPEVNIDDVLPTECGKRPEDFNDEEDLIFAKVVQGSIAPRGTYPWQASIRVRGHSRSSHWCGAVVLSPLHVLTAAHCLEGYNKGAYFVRAGDYNTEIDEGTEAEANIEDYYIHEEFRLGHRMNNDIALVLLKGRGIPLGKHIMPICLPAENAEYPPGLNCTISGFGSVETGKSTQSRDLRYGWVPLLDQSICRAEYVYGSGSIREGMVCAGYLDEGVDTCDGDSGGPLACYHNGAFTLYGITSWGQHCGKANKPGVYVRVAHYRRWIDQKIKESLAGR